MNVAVVCGSYLPTPSAVGICAKNVVGELCHRGHTVVVVCERNSTTGPNADEEVIEGASIKRITTAGLDLLYGNRLQNYMYRVIDYFRAIFSIENINRKITDAYTRAILECHNERPVDMILPFCFPIEAIIAALDFKKAYSHSTYVAPIIFDNFVENAKKHRLSLNKRLKRPRHLMRIRQLIEMADMTYICHSQKAFIEKDLATLASKIKLIEHPLLLKPKFPISSSNVLLYSGAFLANYVKSQDFAKVIEAILPKISQNVEFCVMGNDLAPIMNLANRFPLRIYNHGRVPFAIAEQKISEAGILLSVGEISGIQISSKIFTYISTGKPVIHFYYADTDNNKAVLEKYPLAYFFNLNKINDTTLASLCDFIRCNCGKRMAFDDVADIYREALPATLVDGISSGLNR